MIKKIQKIEMVCLGNICRSPMAEGILRKKIQEKGLSIEVDSAGTGGWHVGQAPDSRMIETAKQNGVEIDDLRARQFTKSDFDAFDCIYVMDESNYKNVAEMADNKEDMNKVQLILNEIYPGENRSVPDPYFGGDKGFQHVYDLLDRATDRIIAKVEAQ